MYSARAACDFSQRIFAMKQFHLEVCVDSLEGALIAEAAGATRIEISRLLEVGGLTPSMELVTDVCRNAKLPVIALIRCKSGDFQYTTAELETMRASAIQMKDTGVVGLAVGASDSTNSLHWDFLEQIADACGSMELVVHRVFDGVQGQWEALVRLKQLGYRRILTSGGPVNAIDGLENLRLWNQNSTNGIEILPAGGIRPCNAEAILRETNCNQLHGSFSQSLNGKQLPIPAEIQQVIELLETRYG
jgi:copper homeostasis protein